jgi:hypothetical protein
VILMLISLIVIPFKLFIEQYNYYFRNPMDNQYLWFVRLESERQVRPVNTNYFNSLIKSDKYSIYQKRSNHNVSNEYWLF